jgi:hypothetical protein
LKRTEYPGAWYVDALPSGERVLLYPGSHLETHAWRVELPTGETFGPQFLKLSPTKDRFFGHAHDIDRPTLYEYLFGAGGRWSAVPTATGRAVYDTHGNILDTLPAGYGYFDIDDNRPISRIETYEQRHGLNNWSHVGALLIGQGHDAGGVLVYDGFVLRVLDTGPCSEINTHLDGTAVAVSYRKDGMGCVIVQTTLAELRALPPYQPLIVPPIVPPPPPEPKPVPERKHLDVVQRVAATLLYEQTLAYAWKLTTGVAWALKDEGCGLHQRPAGGENVMPVGDEFYGASRVMYPDGDLYKVVSDAGPNGENGATWDREKSIEPSRYRPAIEPAGSAPPAPEPTFTLIDTSRLEAILAALINQATALEARVKELEARPQTPAASFPQRIALRTENGHYVCAEGGGGGEVNATRTAAGGWETFDVEPR